MLIDRLHVFADLLPYICMFSGCNDELRQFPSRNAWAEHEWEKHRSCPVWACPECPVECSTSADWIQHVRKVHGRALGSSHGTSAADAAARRRPRIINDGKCHLCNKVLGTSQKDIRNHIGKHLEEVALMALPKENEDGSDRSSVSDHEASYPHGPLVGERPVSASNLSGRCPYQDCGRHCKDLKAHMFTHMSERRFKCSVINREYREKGFTRRYDQNRHVLTHYTGTMVCGFCPGFGTAEAKSFNGADVFERHLISAHGVEPSSSSKGMPSSPGRVERRSVDSSGDAIGICSTCSEKFGTAQEFYEHLDDCVLCVVQREDEASQAMTEHHPPEVVKDLAVQGILDHQVPSSAQANEQHQDSLKRTKTPMSLYQSQNSTVRKQRLPYECTTNDSDLDSRIPSIGDWYYVPNPLRLETNWSESNSTNIKPSDAEQHSIFPTISLPITLFYTLYITSQNGIAQVSPSFGFVHLKDSSAYQTIEQVANASVQKYCDSSRPRESWLFRNGQCTLSEHQPPRPTYALNSVEDWKTICRTLECLLTAQKDLRRYLDIRREYFSSFTQSLETGAQEFTDDVSEKRDS